MSMPSANGRELAFGQAIREALAVGRIAERVVVVDGHPEVRPLSVLSLACDHRVTDGARGAPFLETLTGFIEQPSPMLE